MTLASAIAAAETDTGGRAVKAALKSRYGATVFEVRVVKDHAPQKVLVDATNGKVVPAASREKREDDDD
jgi:uncharacterized membrane protein YkoI